MTPRISRLGPGRQQAGLHAEDGGRLPADDHGGTAARILDFASGPDAGPQPPVIMAVRVGAQLTFRCPYCRRNHWHGAHAEPCAPGCRCALHSASCGPCTCPPGSGDGHRAAHCTADDRSPLKPTGYYLVEVAR